VRKTQKVWKNGCKTLQPGSDWRKKQRLIEASSCDRRKRFKRQAMIVRAAVCRLRRNA
jgi:hypothetical protein